MIWFWMFVLSYWPTFSLYWSAHPKQGTKERTCLRACEPAANRPWWCSLQLVIVSMNDDKGHPKRLWCGYQRNNVLMSDLWSIPADLYAAMTVWHTVYRHSPWPARLIVMVLWVLICALLGNDSLLIDNYHTHTGLSSYEKDIQRPFLSQESGFSWLCPDNYACPELFSRHRQ